LPTPQPPSLIWSPGAGGFVVDNPVSQDATYRYTNFDRSYLDSQIRGSETHLVQSLIGGATCTWVFLDGGSAAAVVGNVVCLAGTATGTVTLATTTPLANAGSALGICMTAANPGSWVRVARGGFVPPSITQLPTSANSLYAKVNVSTATVTTAASLFSTDYPLGTVDAVGNLNMLPQFTPLGASAAVAWTTINSNTTVTTGQSGARFRTDTTGGTLNTITLPAAPTDGCTYQFVDATGQWFAHNLTINGNGKNIVNPANIGGSGAVAGSIVLTQIRSQVSFTWDNTLGSLWQVTS